MPNADHAYVEWPKAAEYLLSPTHDVGNRKAAFFARIGYRQPDAAELIDGLLDIARNGEVMETVADEHGIRYVVDGWLPARMRPPVPLRTVWMIDRDRAYPRLITAYPA